MLNRAYSHLFRVDETSCRQARVLQLNAEHDIDEVLYRTYGQSNGWSRVDIVLPSGTHNYRWQATTVTAAQPLFWIDTIVCSNTAVVPITGGQFGFEDHFVTTEITGGFQIDNSLAQAGAFSAHPPLLAANQKSTMSFSCAGKSHSELLFYYTTGGQFNLPVGQTLSLYIDNVLYRTYGQSNGWSVVDIVVPSGTHSYRWEAATVTAAQPLFWIDTIACADTPVTPITSGTLGFEDHFVPAEIGGGFEIDNSLAQAGKFSAHPPLLAANQKSSLTFSCANKTHNEVSFYYTTGGQFNLPAGQTLSLYIDNTLYKTYGQSNGWSLVDILVQSGVHAYRWEAATTTAAQPLFWIDTIVCQ